MTLPELTPAQKGLSVRSLNHPRLHTMIVC